MIEKFIFFLNKIFKRHRRSEYFSKHEILRIESKINYEFKNKKLIIKALKHRSFLSITNEPRLLSNERLELLGDAILGMIVVEYLFNKYPSKEEGELTAIKSLIVSRKILASISKKIGLGEFILLNDAEEKAGGRYRPSILADVFEAITGAIYLDGGLKTAENFVYEKLLVNMDGIVSQEKYKNFKSILLEFSQGKNMGIPRYVVKKEEGPDHDKLFTIEVYIENKPLGAGKGNSKKKAEQIAAKNALKMLDIL